MSLLVGSVTSKSPKLRPGASAWEQLVWMFWSSEPLTKMSISLPSLPSLPVPEKENWPPAGTVAGPKTVSPSFWTTWMVADAAALYCIVALVTPPLQGEQPRG